MTALPSVMGENQVKTNLPSVQLFYCPFMVEKLPEDKSFCTPEKT